jgi:hypothetical protein
MDKDDGLILRSQSHVFSSIPVDGCLFGKSATGNSDLLSSWEEISDDHHKQCDRCAAVGSELVLCRPIDAESTKQIGSASRAMPPPLSI